MQVTLYGKSGCHLCEEFKRALAVIQAELDFDLVEQDITADAELFGRFQHLIPVLELADGPLLYPPHDLPTVYRTLAAACAPDNSSTPQRPQRS